MEKVDGLHLIVFVFLYVSAMVKFEELFQDADENGFKADRKKRVGGYILGRTLGEGSFAKVRLGTHITTNEKVDVKCWHIVEHYTSTPVVKLCRSCLRNSDIYLIFT